MLICGDRACSGDRPAAAEQAGERRVAPSLGAPSAVHRVVSMAWLMLMLMRMRQLVGGYWAGPQRSNYFFFCFTHKKKTWLNQPPHPLTLMAYPTPG